MPNNPQASPAIATGRCITSHGPQLSLSAKPSELSVLSGTSVHPFENQAPRYARRLIRSFLKRSLWMTVILTLLLAILLPSMIYLHHLKQYEDESARLLSNFIDREIGPAGEKLLEDPTLLAPAIDKIEIFMAFSDFLEFKVWAANGTVIYSHADPALAGETFDNAHLRRVIATSQPETEIESARDDENISLKGFGKLIEMYAPIRANGTTIGAVEVYRKVPPLNLIDTHLFCVLTVVLVLVALLYLFLFGKFKKAAATIVREGEKLSSAYRSLGLSYLNTIRSLLKALELRDMDTEGHAERGVALAIFMAEKLQLPTAELNELVLGAYLHDIGKIGIPDQVLLKNGRLDAVERDIIRTHVTKGLEIIQNISFLQPASDVIRHHHEWWDGTGYPDRLAGEAIPISARIFAIVDVLEALLSERPYKKALPFTEARSIILAGKGCQFDPSLIDIFSEISEQDLSKISEEIHRRGIHQEVNLAVEHMLNNFVAQQGGG